MTLSVMTASVDGSLLIVTGVLSTVIGVALYVWTALALGAMFRKMGEETWKGWVPILNLATVLRWGGHNPWLVLLVLVPVVGPLVVWVLLVISAHRINPGYGYGAGMTVLAALLFVVWASILGFGPAPWRGARPATLGETPPGPARRPAPADGAPGTEPVLAPAVAASFAPRVAPAPAAPEPDAPIVGRTAGTGPVSTVPQAWAPPGGAASPAAPSVPAESVPPAAPAPIAAASDAGESDDDGWPEPAADDGWPSEVDDVSAISPSPFPPSSAAVPGARHVSPPVSEDDEVISFVPGRRSTASDDVARMPAVPPVSVPDPEPVAAEPAPAPVSEPPASRAATRARWTAPDPDAFPELSGEVSAVVGSPAAGAPRSALGAVSAQQRRAEERAHPDEDDVDRTIMVRRKLPTWQLVPSAGSPVALSGDVVILGRRPSADPSFPAAQLVVVEDLARTVSKTHARIELRGEKWLITDLGSTNGVLVRTLMGDEVEIEPGTELAAGERFFLGDEEFRLQHE
ncbi:DUF5684 domain-containing protein [Microbacterium telephonicum]|uniref:FHA domain-containing protein n=1 Tax=Microbacterium telephonicum TaxID=1714841 RepID=A0A498BXM1_9MICO|nr:DUF5684 domain-containing protein [Microbacterium telephonicum]RLK48052.1 FHA domain-containing protein [Microbacterium telephonicum]